MNMRRNTICLIFSVGFIFVDSLSVKAQINNKEIAIRYFKTLNYNIIYWEPVESERYFTSGFLPISVVYGLTDTTYSVAKNTLRRGGNQLSSWDEKNLLYFLPPKNQLLNTIELFSSNHINISYRETKPDSPTSNFDEPKLVKSQILDLENKLKEYSALEWEDYQYTPGTILGTASLIFGALAYSGFSNAEKGNNVGWNRALGIISVSSIVISIPIEVSELIKRKKRRKQMKDLENEFYSY